MNREFDALADDFVTLGLLPPGSDKTEITPALTGVFQDALANGVNNLNFGDLSGSLGQTMYQYNFRIPPYYTLLVRSLSVLEVSSCYAQTSCAVFAEPMCTWPENRACACLLSIHHTHPHSYCHHKHHIFCIREFCMCADQDQVRPLSSYLTGKPNTSHLQCFNSKQCQDKEDQPLSIRRSSYYSTSST